MTYQTLGSSVDFSAGSHPVYAVPSGAVAYLLPVTCPGSVAFNADGSLLGIGLCQYTGAPPEVEVYDAGTGDLAGAISLENFPLTIAFDPVAPRLYVAITDPRSDSAMVRVYDTTTLELRAQLRAPMTVPGQLAASSVALVFSGEPALYLVTMGLSGGQVTSARFSLLP